jgi:aldehyde:ferredoxin oxidoreductase
MGSIVMLSHEVDDLGMDLNETSWLVGMVIECYEKGVLSKDDTDGLEMTWGNIEAVKALVNKMARREGIGGVLAEGVKEAAQKPGSPFSDMGVYTLKGTVPRAHDDRGSWLWLLDHCTSDTSTNDVMGAPNFKSPGYPLEVDPFDYKEVAKLLSNRKGLVPLQDSFVVCMHAAGPYLDPLVQMVGAITGWDFTNEEAVQLGRRIAVLMRAFNTRSGIGIDLDMPSKRYSSRQVDGPIKAESIMTVWPEIRRCYYEELGWDAETGKPLPETLKSLGLGHIIDDIWR